MAQNYDLKKLRKDYNQNYDSKQWFKVMTQNYDTKIIGS